MQTMTNVPEHNSIQHIQQATIQDEDLNVLIQWLKRFIITGWPGTKDWLHQDIRPYSSFKDNLVVIDGMVMKGRYILISETLKQQALDQLHVNHMGIEKNKTISTQIHLLKSIFALLTTIVCYW